MHEERLLRDLVRKVEEVARTHRLARVARVEVWVGALSHLTETQLRARFAELARGGPAERATIDLDRSEDITDPRAQAVILTRVHGPDGPEGGSGS